MMRIVQNGLRILVGREDLGHPTRRLQNRFRCVHHVLGRDAEVLVQLLLRSRRTKAGHSDETTCSADVPLPALLDASFHRDSGRHAGWKNTVAVGLILLVKQFPTRQADNSCLYAIGGQLFVGVQADMYLAAGTDKDDLRISFGRKKPSPRRATAGVFRRPALFGVSRNAKRQGADFTS